jgi:hypothetical protein
MATTRVSTWSTAVPLTGSEVLACEQGVNFRKVTIDEVTSYTPYSEVVTTLTSAAIQTAINNVAALGGGTVQLVAGNYIVSTVIQSDDNVQIKGAGIDATVLVANTSIAGVSVGTDAATDTGVIGAFGKTNCIFSDFTIDMQTNSHPGNGVVLLPAANPAVKAYEDAVVCVDCRVERVKVKGYDQGTSPTGYSIWNRRAKGTRILNNVVTGKDTAVYNAASGQEGIEVFGGENVLISGNYVENYGNAGIFITMAGDFFDTGIKNVIITDNHVKGCRNNIQVQTTVVDTTDANTLYIVDGCIISNNTSEDAYQYGISVLQTIAAPNATDISMRGISIENNYVLTSNALVGAAQLVGIALTRELAANVGLPVGVKVSSNTVIGGKSGTSKGLVYINNIDDVSVIDNVVGGDSQTGTDSYYLFHINNSNYVDIKGNTIRDAARSCIKVSDCDFLTVSDNSFQRTDLLASGIATVYMTGTQQYVVFQDNVVGCPLGVGFVNANSTTTYLKALDNTYTINQNASMINNMDTATCNFGTFTIVDTDFNHVIVNDMILLGGGTQVEVVQTGTTNISAFALVQSSSGTCVVTRASSSGAATYSYLIR